MKNNIQIILQKNLKFLCIIILFASACAKKDANNIVSDQSYIDIEVGGYVSTSLVETTLVQPESTNKARSMRSMPQAEEFASQVFLQTETSTDSESISKHKYASLTKTTPVEKLTQMAPNTKYLVLVFDDANSLVSEPVLSTVGEKTRINIPSRYRASVVNYTVVAFSYNRDQQSDYSAFLAGTIGNDPQVDIPTDREFFYSHSVVPMDFRLSNPQAGGYQGSIELKFQPQTAKVGVVLDAMGSNAKVTAGTGMITSNDLLDKVKVNTAKMNLRVNTISNITSKQEDGSFDLSSTDSNGADSLAYYVYTVVDPADPVINKFKVSFDNISVKRSDGNLVSSGVKNYNFNNITALERGKKVNARIYLFEGSIVNNVLWSSTNLYYDVAAEKKYKFRNTAFEGLNEFATDYWGFKRLLPASNSTSTDDLGDPCAKVYPSGWRLPTEADMDNLTPNAIEFNKTTDNVYSASYTGLNKTLTFAAYGYYTHPATFIGNSNSGSIGVFWIDSDQNQVVGNNRNVLVYTATGISSISGRDDFSWYAPNYSYANIRCVRDAR